MILFIYITMLRGTDNIIETILIHSLIVGIFYELFLVPPNIVMNLNNVIVTKIILYIKSYLRIRRLLFK